MISNYPVSGSEGVSTQLSLTVSRTNRRAFIMKHRFDCCVILWRRVLSCPNCVCQTHHTAPRTYLKRITHPQTHRTATSNASHDLTHISLTCTSFKRITRPKTHQPQTEHTTSNASASNVPHDLKRITRSQTHHTNSIAPASKASQAASDALISNALA